jgi:hypothetical protein
MANKVPFTKRFLMSNTLQNHFMMFNNKDPLNLNTISNEMETDGELTYINLYLTILVTELTIENVKT